MGKLYWYEWKKLFRQRSFLFFSLLLLVGNLFALYQFEKNKDAYQFFYQSKSAFESYRDGDTAVTNAEYYQALTEDAKSYVSSYGDFLKQIPEQEKRYKETSYYQDKDTYLYRNLEKTVADYSSLSPDGLKADLDIGIKELSAYDYGIYFQMIFLFVLSYFVISVERKRGLFLLTKGTRRGHLPLAAAKLLTMLSASTLYGILQEGSTAALMGYFYGYDSLGKKIQSIALFRNCTLSVSVGLALVLLLLIRILIGLLCTVLIFCLTMSFRKEGIALFVYAGFIGLELFFFHTIETSSPWNILKCINPFFCWNMEQAFGVYLNLNVFGYPVGKGFAALLTGGFFAALLAVTGMNRFSHSCQISSGNLLEEIRERVARRLSFQWHHTSVFLFEFRKVFFLQKRGYLILILLLFCIMASKATTEPVIYDNPDDAEYHRILKEINGPVTQESLDYIKEQREQMDSVYAEMAKLGKEDGEEADFRKSMLQHEIELKEGGLSLVEMQRDLLMEKPGSLSDKRWIDEKSYLNCFLDYQYDLMTFLLGAAAMIFFMSSIEVADERKGLYPLLCTTKTGKKKIRRRKTCVCMAGMLWCVLCVGIPQILRYFAIDGFTNAGQRLSDFTSIELNTSLTVGAFLVLLFLGKLLLFALAFALVLLLVKKVHNHAVIIGTSICTVGIAVLLLWYFKKDLAAIMIQIFSPW